MLFKKNRFIKASHFYIIKFNESANLIFVSAIIHIKEPLNLIPSLFNEKNDLI